MKLVSACWRSDIARCMAHSVTNENGVCLLPKKKKKDSPILIPSILVGRDVHVVHDRADFTMSGTVHPI